MANRYSGNLAVIVILAAVAGVYLLLVVLQLDRPLVYDDVNFARAARQVAAAGLPFGNQGWMSDLGDFSRREQWALWHPPLYVYLLGGVARVFGASDVALRLPGVMGGLATLVLTYALAREVTAGTTSLKRTAGCLAVALAVLSPLSVQSALVLDIDFSLLLPLSLLFLLLYLRWEEGRRWPLLALLFALLLWSKMTNPLALLGSIVAWQLLRGKLRRAGSHLAVIGGAGGALFIATWRLLSLALGMPFEMPFAVNAVQWRDSSDVARHAYSSLEAFANGLMPMVMWLGPWLVFAGLLAAGVRAGELAERWQVRKVDLLLGAAVALVLGYVDKNAAWLPKYQVALAPLLAVAYAPLAARSLLMGGWRAGLASVIAGGGALYLARTLTRDGWALERSWALSDTEAQSYLAAASAALLVGVALRTRVWPLLPALALGGLALGWGLGTGWVMAGAPYSTTYQYGTRGLAEAATWVDQHVRPDQLYVSAKDVAYRSNADRFMDQDTMTALIESGHFTGTWEGEPIQVVVAWTREPYHASLLERQLPELGFRLELEPGDYRIYVR